MDGRTFPLVVTADKELVAIGIEVCVKDDGRATTEVAIVTGKVLATEFIVLCDPNDADNAAVTIVDDKVFDTL